jgi:hypothetical protein
MAISLDDLDEFLKPRSVLYFQSDVEGFNEPHHMICLAISETEICSFGVCTSQEEKMHQKAEKYGAHTIVHINHRDAENPLNKATYVNCNNDPIKHTKEEVIQFFQNSPHLLQRCWVLPESKYLEIIQGLNASVFIDDSIRQSLPTIQEIIDGNY